MDPGAESTFSDRFSSGTSVLEWTSETDATMLAFQETMRAFLETQQAVIGAYLGSSPSRFRCSKSTLRNPFRRSGRDDDLRPGAGPLDRRGAHGWSPAPRSRRSISWTLGGDPIAEHHTLGGRRVSALDPTLKGLPVLPFAVMAEMTARGGRAGRHAGAGARRARAGPGAQVGALRGRRRSPGTARPSRAFDRPGDAARLGRPLQPRDRRPGGRPAPGVRGRRGLRRLDALPRRRRAPGTWTIRGPADSRPNRSTGSSGSSTGRRSRPLVEVGGFSAHGIDGSPARPALGAVARARASPRACTPT